MSRGLETMTQDSVFDGAFGGQGEAADLAKAQLQPRLRVLHHADLDRFGAVSAFDAVPVDGGWLDVGRNAPRFTVGGASPRPIEDPRVSREQLRVRWSSALKRFELSPAEGARRRLRRVDPDKPGSPAALIEGPTLLPAGACVAIGDVVLLGLELASARADDADRLGLVGESEALWALRDEILSVAQFGRSALISGPTGAGKELVARALHRTSARAARPFVPVNCAALPSNLVESVLFGHKKGAFTGADADEPGLFRAADGGTLFFDELGELPLAVQPKLLRVLQDGVVTPVGAHRGVAVDVRVIAATHRDLEAQVRAGGLREDLYHRMAAHVLRVPSLAERRFDVPELFAHTLRQLRAEHPSLDWLWSGGRVWQGGLPISFVVELLGHGFPGNVRELQNVAERAARMNVCQGTFRAPRLAGAPSTAAPPTALDSGRVDAVVDDPRSKQEGPAAPATDALVRAACESLGLARKTVLKLFSADALTALAAEAERAGDGDVGRVKRLQARASDALLALLEADDYNQSAVAAAIGASRTTLIKLMDDLGLPRAMELEAETIARARRQVGGDLDAAARLLRVSPRALKKRLTQLETKA